MDLIFCHWFVQEKFKKYKILNNEQSKLFSYMFRNHTGNF